MYLYESACVLHDFHCGQLLLTAADLQDRERQLNVANCIQALLAKGILPVINENDSVSVDEIRFGDNDVLAALTAAMVRADLTVLLTSVDGLRVREAEGFGHRISVVEHLSDGVWAMAGDTDGNPFSTGGMRSKLRAADVVNRAGEPLWIADGSDFSALRQVFAGADIGTLFTATVTNGRMRSRKRFLAFFSEPAGDVEVDAGAARALRFAGKSLLPSGVRDVRGVFSRGDTVRILDNTGQELGRGVTNYASSELQRIRGCQTADIRRILGHDAYPEVAHRDFLVITAGPEPQEDSQP
jgi:glutamate 5-kinase